MVYGMPPFYRPCCRANVQRYGNIAPYAPPPSIASSSQETTAVCALWSGNLHLEVEDISRVPVFEKTLKLKTTTYGHPGVHHFKSLLT